MKWSLSSKHGEENERGGKTILFSKQEKKENGQSKTAKFSVETCASIPAHNFLFVSLVNEWSYAREKGIKWIEESL